MQRSPYVFVPSISDKFLLRGCAGIMAWILKLDGCTTLPCLVLILCFTSVLHLICLSTARFICTTPKHFATVWRVCRTELAISLLTVMQLCTGFPSSTACSGFCCSQKTLHWPLWRNRWAVNYSSVHVLLVLLGLLLSKMTTWRYTIHCEKTAISRDVIFVDN